MVSSAFHVLGRCRLHQDIILSVQATRRSVNHISTQESRVPVVKKALHIPPNLATIVVIGVQLVVNLIQSGGQKSLSRNDSKIVLGFLLDLSPLVSIESSLLNKKGFVGSAQVDSLPQSSFVEQVVNGGLAKVDPTGQQSTALLVDVVAKRGD